MRLLKAKKRGVALLAAVAFTLAAGTPARAQDANRYAVVTITNASQDVTMNYSFKWGTGQWQTYTLAPGQNLRHYWTYRFLNQNNAPVPSLAFWTGINRQRSLQSYNLQAYATPLSNSGGKPYNFVRISANEDYMDLQTGD